MKEISLHILDIVQNSVSAKASEVKIDIAESISENIIKVSISDNGCGMDKEFLKNVTDPFTTTRTTRKVGLGIPLFKLAAEQAGGSFSIESEKGVGTIVRASFEHNNIDRSPIGDMAGTLISLVSVNETVDFVYSHTAENGTFIFDTKEIRNTLGEVPLSEYEVLNWIEGYINEGLYRIKATTY